MPNVKEDACVYQKWRERVKYENVLIIHFLITLYLVTKKVLVRKV